MIVEVATRNTRQRFLGYNAAEELNRRLIEGLNFVEEPKVLRFFFGRLEPVSDWQVKLMEKFRKDFGDSL